MRCKGSLRKIEDKRKGVDVTESLGEERLSIWT